jgi:hypothetical protein
MNGTRTYRSFDDFPPLSVLLAPVAPGLLYLAGRDVAPRKEGLALAFEAQPMRISLERFIEATWIRQTHRLSPLWLSVERLRPHRTSLRHRAQLEELYILRP